MQFIASMFLQVYAQLNHIGVALSYTATLKVVDVISELHKAPVREMLESASFSLKFVDDNVQKHKGVRDIRSDHRGMMMHMYSLLAMQTRTPTASSLAKTGSTGNLHSMKADYFLPTKDDIQHIRQNLTILVGRILCEHIHCLQPFAQCIPNHIPHEYYSHMSKESQTWFLDVLVKNEASNSDMAAIMKTMQNYLGNDLPSATKVLSGGDQLTCERQCGVQRHFMDADTPQESLQLIEPVCEDWHALMCFMKVSTIYYTLYTKSLFFIDFVEKALSI